MGNTLVDIVVANPTRRDFVERVARQVLDAATNAERTHYRERASGTSVQVHDSPLACCAHTSVLIATVASTCDTC